MVPMTTQSKPISFPAWFQGNPGHVARALPVSFGVFSVVLVTSFLLPGSNMSATFTAASLAAAGAGSLHVCVCYLKTLFASIRPESDETEPSGISLIEIMAGLAVVAVIALAVVPVLASVVGR